MNEQLMKDLETYSLLFSFFPMKGPPIQGGDRMLRVLKNVG